MIERHFAEMMPDLLVGLHANKPSVYSYILQPKFQTINSPGNE